MFGIAGLDTIGVIPGTFGFAAVLLGLAVVLCEKGTQRHPAWVTHFL
jgi:hypothetical protein